MDNGSRLEAAAHSARWFAFAKHADGRRRRTYWHLAGRLRPREMRQRRLALTGLPPGTTRIDPGRGFAVVGPHDVPGVQAVVDEVQRLRTELPFGAPDDGKPYLLDQPIVHLDPSSALLRLALEPDVVAAAARYLGLVPVLTGVTLLASLHVPGPPSGSQLFHSDWEDLRQVKVFVSCTSVAPENGPLTAVTADASRRVKDAVGYRYGGAHFRLPDNEVLPRLNDDELVPFTGPAGTLTFIDTSSCLHFGSRVAPGAAERLVVQFQYLTPPAFDLLFRRRSSRPFGVDAKTLTPAQRLVLKPRS